MMPLTSLADHLGRPVVLDASVCISLNATERAHDVLRVLPHSAVVPDLVLRELETGRITGRRDSSLVRELAETDALTIRALGSMGLANYEKLVVGAAVETLDDGEAATIAYALEADGIAVIDERKGNRICATRFATLPRASFIDLITHPIVRQSLGDSGLANALVGALQNGRTRVAAHHLSAVVAFIGPEYADCCSSLGDWRRRIMA